MRLGRARRRRPARGRRPRSSASGFSTQTCLPARSAASAIAWWRDGGVATTTASTSSGARGARRSRRAARAPGCVGARGGEPLRVEIAEVGDARAGELGRTSAAGSCPSTRRPTMAMLQRLALPSSTLLTRNTPCSLRVREAVDVVARPRQRDGRAEPRAPRRRRPPRGRRPPSAPTARGRRRRARRAPRAERGPVRRPAAHQERQREQVAEDDERRATARSATRPSRAGGRCVATSATRVGVDAEDRGQEAVHAARQLRARDAPRDDRP